MLDAHEVTTLHRTLVARYQEDNLDNPASGLLGIVGSHFEFAFFFWHAEYTARNQQATSQQLADISQTMSRYKQLRNDWIENIDQAIDARLRKHKVVVADDAPQNSETPGSVIDRLAILSLQIFHLETQAFRTDVAVQYIASVRRKLSLYQDQLHDLAAALKDLVADLLAGRKRHKVCPHLKIYDDPTLNPHLYSTVNRRAG